MRPGPGVPMTRLLFARVFEPRIKMGGCRAAA